MNKKNILSMVFSLLVITTFAQSWRTSISKINLLCEKYDPYIRIFSYEEYSNKITFITKEGDITIKAVLNDINCFVEPSGDNFYVTFKCIDGSSCINSSYSGATKLTSITLTSRSAADEIVQEINKIKNIKSGIDLPAEIITASNVGIWQANIDRVNALCVKFDPYIRKFSYDKNSNKLTWVDKDGDISITAPLNDVKIFSEPNGSSAYVTFECLDGSTCIGGDYYKSGTKASSISVNNMDAADKIVAELNMIKNGNSRNNQNISSKAGIWQSNIDRINDLCVKYDPYIRHFSYDKDNDKLTWITNDKDITVDGKLSNLKFSVSSNTNDFSLSFECIDGTQCMGGDYYKEGTKLTSITLNSKSAADDIVSEFEKIKAGTGNKPLVVSKAGIWQTNIDRVNDLCVKYDPYIRHFSYDKDNDKLTWITNDKDITVDGKLSNLKFSVSSNTNDFSLSFECIDGTQCMGGDYYKEGTKLTSITLNSKSAADEIVREFEKIKAGTEKKQLVVSNAGIWQSNIDRINDLCVKYDPYIRHFSYDKDKNVLTFITNDKDITIDGKMSELKFFVEPSGSNYYVSFECLDGSKCLNSTYSGPTNTTSITIKSLDAADKIVAELNLIKNAFTGVSATPKYDNNVKLWQTSVNRINELCVKYDPYIRKFSYNENTNELTWVNKDGDITSKAKLDKITMNLKASTGVDYYVQFLCKTTGSKCIDCTYGGASDLNAITVTNKEAGEEIVKNVERIIEWYLNNKK